MCTVRGTDKTPTGQNPSHGFLQGRTKPLPWFCNGGQNPSHGLAMLDKTPSYGFADPDKNPWFYMYDRCMDLLLPMQA